MPRASTKLSPDPAFLLPARQWAAMGVLVLGVLAAVVIGLWQFQRRAHDYLREALGEQVEGFAVTIAATVPGDSLAFWALRAQQEEWTPPLQATLTRVRQDNDLANLFLCLPGGEVVLDVSQSLLLGEVNPFLALDAAEVEIVRSGIATHSRLYHTVGDEFFMSGYAPIYDSLDEVAGFVGVEAGVGYFDALGQLRRSLLLIGATVVVLVTLLMLVWLFYARRLARARQALLRNETLSAMGRMTAGIAHEIRNPLGIIKNTAQLLKEDLEEKGVEAELIEYIPEEVDRLNEILTGYLDFARQAPPRRVELDLTRLLRRTLKLFETDFKDHAIEVEENFPATPVKVDGDPHRLQQVFLNLILNALQAMPQGGRLSLELTEQAQAVKVEISDTGVGLEPQDARHLFEPFVTSKEKGSGLGLSVVRGIVVEDHGGRVQLTGAPGKGATAVVELPRRAPRDA